jgi:hypothetical protein
MADLDAYDEQDQSEVFDEDNTNDMDRGPGEEAEQLEDLVDVFDVTRAVGDVDDNDALIGDEMDDEDIVSSAIDNDDDDDDLEDDDLAPRSEEMFNEEEDLTDVNDGEDPDLEIAAHAGDEVELEYVGDLNDLEGASSAAQDLESDNLSDADLRELDYKDEFTVDEDGDSARA